MAKALARCCDRRFFIRMGLGGLAFAYAPSLLHVRAEGASGADGPEAESIRTVFRAKLSCSKPPSNTSSAPSVWTIRYRSPMTWAGSLTWVRPSYSAAGATGSVCSTEPSNWPSGPGV